MTKIYSSIALVLSIGAAVISVCTSNIVEAGQRDVRGYARERDVVAVVQKIERENDERTAVIMALATELQRIKEETRVE